MNNRIKMTTLLLPRILSSSVAVANNAGKIIREIMSKGELGIVTKEHAKDIQTEADRTAQNFIIASLNSHFPNIKIIGEEDEIGHYESILPVAAVASIDIKCPDQYSHLKEEEIVVWVDPLDGTAEYTQAYRCSLGGYCDICTTRNFTCSSLLDHVTVLIGIAAFGKVIGGVIHQPYYNYQNTTASELGRTIWSIVGGGIGGIEPNPPPKEGCIVTTTRSHSSSTVNDAVASVNPTDVLRVGGAGHKVLLLLEGKAHTYVFASPGCKKWDTAAPQALLEAAGGKLTDINGKEIPYDAEAPHRNSTGVLAVAPGLNHADFLNKIPQHVKDNLKA